jgi:hypothetical protein
MDVLMLQLTELALFLLGVAGLLVGVLWLLWVTAKLFKLGCFHPSVKQNQKACQHSFTDRL